MLCVQLQLWTNVYVYGQRPKKGLRKVKTVVLVR